MKDTEALRVLRIRISKESNVQLNDKFRVVEINYESDDDFSKLITLHALAKPQEKIFTLDELKSIVELAQHKMLTNDFANDAIKEFENK